MKKIIKNDKENFIKSIIIIILLLSVFVFLVSFGTLYAQTHIIEGTACSCTLPIPLLIPTFSSFGIIVGAIVYYFGTYHKVASYEELKRNLNKLVKKDLEKHTTIDTRIFLNFLDRKEKLIMEKIIENQGEITQSKLSALFGKVVTFRAVESLKNKGIVRKEKHGKTNKIVLEEKYKRLLLK